MAALDTNVLVRFLAHDDAAQSAAATALVERAVADGEPLYLPLTVALELEWVLRSRFELSKDEILATFGSLLTTTDLHFGSEDLVELALARYRESNADFSDCLHLASAIQAGQVPLWTLDRMGARIDGVRLLA